MLIASLHAKISKNEGTSLFLSFDKEQGSQSL